MRTSGRSAMRWNMKGIRPFSSWILLEPLLRYGRGSLPEDGCKDLFEGHGITNARFPVTAENLA